MCGEEELNICKRCENEIPEGKAHIIKLSMKKDGGWEVIKDTCVEMYICKCNCHPLQRYCDKCLNLCKHPERIEEVKSGLNERIRQIVSTETHTARFAEGL